MLWLQISSTVAMAESSELRAVLRGMDREVYTSTKGYWYSIGVLGRSLCRISRLS